jgi:hypothetical protein
MNKNILIWTLAVVITLSAAFYQRTTGPTYPKKFTVTTKTGDYSFKLKRSHSIGKDFYVELKDAPETLSGKVIYRPYPTDHDWTEADLIRENNTLKAQLPNQPAAGKLQYYLILDDGGKTMKVADNQPVIIRFKGDVPAGFMIPHILFMFIAMLFANLTGIMVIFKDKRYKKYLNLAFFALLIGGMILGPIIQKYAFGHFWTGFPFGFDLTDNKTLISVVFFAIAFFGNLKRERAWMALIAVIVLLLIYSVPHSMFGSELDYASGQVITGN